MTKRTFAAILAAFLLVGVVPQASAATAKAGAACSKLKATSVVKGKKFTCIKSGKKLVWDKGVTVKPPAEPTTKSPTVEPITPQLPVETDARKAFDAITKIANSITIKPIDIESVASPGVNAASVAEIENRYSFVANFFDAQLPANTPVTLVISTNEEIEWAESQLSKLNGNSFAEWLSFFLSPSLNNPCGSYYSAGSNGKTLDKRILNNYSLFGKSCATQLPKDLNFKSTIEHEWVHNVQNAVSFKADQLEQNMPCWFKEGQASYYGGVLGYRNDYSGYLKFREWNMKNGKYQHAPDRTDIYQNLKKLDESYSPFTCGSDGGYSIGSIAVERMVLLKGHAGILAFMQELKNQNYWQDAFKVVYGIDGDQWLVEAGKEIKKEYFAAGIEILPPVIELPVCPSPSNSDQNGITRKRANALVGMDEANAEQCAASLNWGYRVGQRDEEFYATTKDYRLDRVTVVIMSGLVTRVDVG
ncbi:MAG: hypothetical protein K9F92_00635 [Candidatus Nanopelagicaceae bacterium]|nr:hypothetical protein [Candidatus Nanopelagicaceae bacterium]